MRKIQRGVVCLSVRLFCWSSTAYAQRTRSQASADAVKNCNGTTRRRPRSMNPGTGASTMGTHEASPSKLDGLLRGHKVKKPAKREQGGKRERKSLRARQSM
ncbi:hypothetical protein LI328DRAFT_128808 [Trichoderma asperelloides]|nr:hypothetical protein LI328DRAFT_128808 [Trichoderma asperelloides]